MGSKPKHKLTVQEHADKIIGDSTPKACSWYEINRISEDLWDKGNKLEYVGETIDEANGKNKMVCIFQENIRNSNNTYRKGKLFMVDNDVVFKYQKTKKPVVRKEQITTRDVLD